MLRWNRSPREKRDVGDWLVSSKEADLTGGFNLDLLPGRSSDGPADGGVKPSWLEELGRGTPS